MGKNSNNMSNDKKPVLYVMFYSHLDTQWRWDYTHTIKEYIKNTLKDNFSLLEKYENYVFNFSGANRYRYMKEYYPDDYDLVKKYIAEKRWFPCGSSVEENDVLVPSFESIIRHVLYGNDYFRKEFGCESKEYMLPDCFGFPASLPSILAHCGLTGFSTQKLTWGSAEGIPFNFGFWVGPDNKSILAAFNPGDYITQVREDLSKNDNWFKRIKALGEKSGIYMEYMYVGTGDLGGAPDEESVKKVEESIKSDGDIKVIPSAADIFFINAKSQDTSKLPTYQGELLLTNHSAGSLTSEAYIKRWNRKNELLAYAAEATAVIGNCLCGIDYPKTKLKEAWRLVQSAQFHDILPGTCIPKAYEYSWNDQILALNQFSDVLVNSIGRLSCDIDTMVDGIPLIIYNPLSFDRKEVVEAMMPINCKTAGFLKVFDKDNNEIPSQTKEQNENEIIVLFYAEAPSLGFTVYNVKISTSPCEIKTHLAIDDTKIENDNLLIKINKNSDISVIYDKINKKEILTDPVRLAFMYERPKEFPAWNMDWVDREKEPAGFVDGEAKVTIKEFGPVRVTLQVERESRGSLFVQDISLAYTDSFITIGNKIDWFTKESSLKAVFPLRISNPKAVYNCGIGKIERGNNDPKKFEVPSYEWFDLSAIDNSYGVSIMDDSKYGSDKPADNILRLTLLYTPGVRKDFRDQATQDFGRHEFKFAIYPHKGNWQEAESDRNAASFNQPLIPFISRPHKGRLGKSFSFIKINNSNILVSALKKAENSDEIIIRIIETKGKEQKNVEITGILPLKSAVEVNGQEIFIRKCNLSGEKLKFDIEKYGIKTFALKFDENTKHEQIHQNIRLPLPLNIKTFSKDKEKSLQSFNKENKTYPFESIPESVIAGEIKFNLNISSHNSNNALKCNGEKILLPDGDYNYLHLLAVSADHDIETLFKIDEIEHKITIQSWNKYIGQWDNRLWYGDIQEDKPDYYWGNIDYIGLEPGYIKRSEVAYFTTHIHDENGNNLPYSYGYIFKYKIPISKGAKTFVLPNDENIIIFSAILSNNKSCETSPACFLYDNFNRLKSDYNRFQVCIKPKIETESFIVEPDKTISVKLYSPESDSEIRYTLDGSEPTFESQEYIDPLSISETLTLKAATFKNGKEKSEVVSFPFYRAYKVKAIKYQTAYSPKYTGSGDNTLIDSMRASSSSLDKAWIGYEVNDLDVILDMEYVITLNKITIGFLSNNSSWIFLPTTVQAFLSDDGNQFSEAAAVNIRVPEKDGGMWIENVSLYLNGKKGRYIHIVAKNLKRCPDWHHGAGGNVWLFADEIIVE
jgi:alpha-mannosidase